MKIIRIALHESVSGDDMDAFAFRHDWDLQNVIHETDENPYEVIWVAPEGNTYIHFIADYYIAKNYLLIRGPKAEAVAEFVNSKLKVISREDLFSRFENNKSAEALSDVVFLAGLLSNEENFPEFKETFIAGFESESSEARQNTILASGYSQSPELKDLILTLIEKETDPDTKEYGINMLESLEKLWAGQLT